LTGKKIWNVAAFALAYRLHDIGMLSDWHYRTTCMELGRRGYRTDEPGGNPRESSQLLTKVFGSLRRRGVSLGDVAHELAITPEDLNGYVFGLVLTALEGNHISRREADPPTLTLVETASRPSCGLTDGIAGDNVLP
jgi:hypothetical protein